MCGICSYVFLVRPCGCLGVRLLLCWLVTIGAVIPSFSDAPVLPYQETPARSWTAASVSWRWRGWWPRSTFFSTLSTNRRTKIPGPVRRMLTLMLAVVWPCDVFGLPSRLMCCVVSSRAETKLAALAASRHLSTAQAGGHGGGPLSVRSANNSLDGSVPADSAIFGAAGEDGDEDGGRLLSVSGQSCSTVVDRRYLPQVPRVTLHAPHITHITPHTSLHTLNAPAGNPLTCAGRNSHVRVCAVVAVPVS